MRMLQIEVRAVSANGRCQAVRQQVVNVPAVFVKKPAWLERYYRFAGIKTAKQKIAPMLKRRVDDVIVASSKGGLDVALEFMGKKGKRKPRIDHKRQHKPDHRRVDIYH